MSVVLATVSVVNCCSSSVRTQKRLNFFVCHCGLDLQHHLMLGLNCHSYGIWHHREQLNPLCHRTGPCLIPFNNKLPICKLLISSKHCPLNLLANYQWLHHIFPLKLHQKVDVWFDFNFSRIHVALKGLFEGDVLSLCLKLTLFRHRKLVWIDFSAKEIEIHA